MTPAGALLLSAYRGVTALLEPAAGPFLRRRLQRGKEDRLRLGERTGRAGRPRPPGPLAWVHGASVGEGVALLPLVERLTRRGFTILVTTGTVTSAHVLDRRLPAGAIHQFLPLDGPGFMRRFLDHWRPDLAILAESELWPNLVFEVARRRIPLVLANARLSQRSFDRWRRLPGLIGGILERIDLCLAQTDADAARLAALGARHVQVTGNLKFDVPPPPADHDSVSDLAGRIGARPAWVAASTHIDEEPLLLAAHLSLLPRFPDLLTIVVPRQAERGASIASRAAELGLTARLRSLDEPLDAAAQVYLGDTMGELGLFYRVAGIVFVGKSLAGGGGQNPIEAAKLGSAILHGPQVSNFTEVYRTLDAAGGAMQVADGEALAEALAGLFTDMARLRRLARSAAESVEANCGATDRIMRALEPFCSQVCPAPVA